MYFVFGFCISVLLELTGNHISSWHWWVLFASFFVYGEIIGYLERKKAGRP